MPQRILKLGVTGYAYAGDIFSAFLGNNEQVANNIQQAFINDGWNVLDLTVGSIYNYFTINIKVQVDNIYSDSAVINRARELLFQFVNLDRIVIVNSSPVEYETPSNDRSALAGLGVEDALGISFSTLAIVGLVALLVLKRK